MSARKAAPRTFDAEAFYAKRGEFGMIYRSPQGTFTFANRPGGTKPPLSMRHIRELLPDGLTRVTGSKISPDETFYATGRVSISDNYRIMIIEVIPATGIPGWIELEVPKDVQDAYVNARMPRDLIEDAFEFWFVAADPGKRDEP